MSDLGWGLGMAVAGMGTVFALLIVLMLLLLLIGRLDRARTPAPQGDVHPGDGRQVNSGDDPAALAEAGSDPAGGGSADPRHEAEDAPVVRVLADGLTEDELAAITVAVLSHRDVRRRQAAPEQRAHQPGSHLYASRWVAVGRAQQTQPWRRK